MAYFGESIAQFFTILANFWNNEALIGESLGLETNSTETLEVVLSRSRLG